MLWYEICMICYAMIYVVKDKHSSFVVKKYMNILGKLSIMINSCLHMIVTPMLYD